jgi:hypothetical protein
VRRTRRGAARTAQAGAGGDPLVALAARLIVAQTALAAAIGLSYSRRHLPSILITLMLVAVLWGLVLVVRSGTQAAWVFAIGLESSFILFGLFRFFTSRYLGGTLLAVITFVTLLHPAVARAFSAPAGRAGEAGLAETADGAL